MTSLLSLEQAEEIMTLPLSLFCPRFYMRNMYQRVALETGTLNTGDAPGQKNIESETLHLHTQKRYKYRKIVKR